MCPTRRKKPFHARAGCLGLETDVKLKWVMKGFNDIELESVNKHLLSVGYLDVFYDKLYSDLLRQTGYDLIFF